jgi:AcrR family transcriptional regulator
LAAIRAFYKHPEIKKAITLNSMSKNNSEKIWTEAGYNQFAAEGLEGIRVERLANITSLNKSGYYHYFGDRTSYLEALMQKHLNHAIDLAQDLRQIQQFDPEFMKVLIKYTTPVLVHNQLVRNRHDMLLVQTYDQVNNIVDPIVTILFADFIGFKNHLEFALKYYSQVRDMFYSQITAARMNYPFLREFMFNAKEVIQHAVVIASKTNSQT